MKVRKGSVIEKRRKVRKVIKGSVIEDCRVNWHYKTWHTGNGYPGWDQAISVI